MVILPVSALELLSQYTTMDPSGPMTFRCTSPKTERSIYCGVMEFTADEKIMFMPQWMMA